jgi:hypothetical protein
MWYCVTRLDRNAATSRINCDLTPTWRLDGDLELSLSIVDFSRFQKMDDVVPRIRYSERKIRGGLQWNIRHRKNTN